MRGSVNRWSFMGMIWLGCLVPAYAQMFPQWPTDPFRPNQSALAVSPQMTYPLETSITVQGLFKIGGRYKVMVDGMTLSKGDRIGVFEIVQITDHSLIIRTQNGDLRRVDY